MTKVVSPSAQKITVGQISKLFDLISAGLLKAGLPSEQSQQVIEEQGKSLVARFVEDFKRRVVEVIKLTQWVKVDRTRTSQQALDATHCKQSIDEDVVKTMPKGEGEEVEIVFFVLNHPVDDDDQLEEEYALRGLKAVDPISLAAVNEPGSGLAEEHRNYTHWKDAEGRWCSALFDWWYKGRFLVIDREKRYLPPGVHFAGVRK